MPKNTERIPVPAAAWWSSVSDTFRSTLVEFLARAKAADRREMGHDCGHLFTITVQSIGHSGIVGEGPESHADAQYSDVYRPVVVRAHNLRDALLLAAAEPLASWLDDEVDEEVARA